MYYFLEDVNSEEEVFDSISYANDRITSFLDIGHIAMADKYYSDVALLKSRYPEYLL